MPRHPEAYMDIKDNVEVLIVFKYGFLLNERKNVPNVETIRSTIAETNTLEKILDIIRLSDSGHTLEHSYHINTPGDIEMIIVHSAGIKNFGVTYSRNQIDNSHFHRDDIWMIQEGKGQPVCGRDHEGDPQPTLEILVNAPRVRVVAAQRKGSVRDIPISVGTSS